MLGLGPCVQRPLRAPVSGLRAAPLGCCSYSPSPASAVSLHLGENQVSSFIFRGRGRAIATHTLTDDKYCTIFRGRRAQRRMIDHHVLIAVNKEINNERGERAWRNTSSLVFFLLKHYSPILSVQCLGNLLFLLLF